MQFHPDSPNLTQSHSKSLKCIQTPSVTLEFIQIHSVSLQNGRLSLLRTVSFRLTGIDSDVLNSAQTGIS